MSAERSLLHERTLSKNPDSITSLTLELLHKLSGTFPLRAAKTLAPFANSLVMARINANTRAAATMINALESLCSIVFNAPAYYIPTVVGKTISEGNHGRVGRDTQAAWLIALLFASPQIMLMALTGPLFKLLQQEQAVTDIAAKYFQTYAFSIIALSLQSASDQVAQTAGHIYSPAIVNGIGLGIMVFLSIGLGLGKFGLPELGVQGVAIAAVVRALFNFLAYTSYAGALSFFKEEVRKLQLFKIHSNYWNSIKPQLLNGIILTIAFCSLIGGQFLISSIVGRMGTTALSAELVISQWQEFLLIPAVSIGAAVQIAISKAIESKPQNIFRYGNIAVVLSLVAPLVYNVITFARPRWLIEPFLNTNLPENAAITSTLETKHLLFINGINMLLNTIQMTLGSALMGADRVLIPTVLGILTNWLVMGLAWKFAENVQQLNLFIGLGYLLSSIVIGGYWGYLRIAGKFTPNQESAALIEKSLDKKQVEDESLHLKSEHSSAAKTSVLDADLNESHGSHRNYGQLAASAGMFATKGATPLMDDDEEMLRVGSQKKQQSWACAIL